MKTQKTTRGFRLIEFHDIYATPCSLQESSLACPPAIWLGVDDHSDDRKGGRMHLDREQARWLAELLMRFADGEGNLPDRHKKSPERDDVIAAKEAP